MTIKKEGECVFTTPIGKRIGAFVLAGAIAGNIYISSKILNKVEEDKEITFEVTVSEVESEDKSNYVQEDDLGLVPVVTESKEEPCKKVCELYDRLLVSGCDMNDVNRELQNVLLVKLTGMKVMAEDRLVLFNVLGKTISIEEDVVEYYYPLASYVHLSSCTKTHSQVEGAVCCESLLNGVEELDIPTFSEFITTKAYESGSLSLRDAIDRINYSDYTLDECLVELDAIYNVCTIPSDMSEEMWNRLFGRLLTVTGECENVCFVFYDLAVLVHKSVCEYPHYANQFGATECEQVTFKLT